MDCGTPGRLVVWKILLTFAPMQITKKKIFTKQEDGTYLGRDAYRLTKSYRDSGGKERKSHVLYLGSLDGLSKSDRTDLARMLTEMIEHRQAVMSDNASLYELAMEFYLKYRETKCAQEDDPVLKAEAERKERERRRDLVTIRLSSLVQRHARTIGPEAICRSTANVLKIREFLNSRGWTREQVDLALIQIIARAIYLYSELKTVRHEDCRHQEIRLQMGKVEIEGEEHRALLVDSDAKALKEQSMHDQACKRYEEELEAIRSGIAKKGGTKLRDAVNARLGRLYKQYGAIRKEYDVMFTYEGKGKKEKAVSMEWKRKEESIAARKKFHGKYVLLTSLDETQELNIWEFYNVIRTVDETFHTLKSDLDIRPVFHKSDDGIKAHLNLAVLAYWIVSVTKYRLKLKEYPNVRWNEIMRIAQAQVVVTAEMQTEDGQTVAVRQSTEAEEELARIYNLLEVCANPIGKVKSVVPLKPPLKNPPPD